MSLNFFEFLSELDALFWGYVGFSLIICLGAYFTVATRFFQLAALPQIFRTFFHFLFHKPSHNSTDQGRGVHPLKAFFASVGGMIGLGNVVGIVTAVQLGGPGALLWVWVAGLAGSLIKYSEIYLGLKYRVKNKFSGYDGGPMFFLKKAFNVQWVSSLVCVLLCIYGAEIYQFHIIVDTLSHAWSVPSLLISLGLLAMILYTVMGGVFRVGSVCAWMMPIFLLAYLSMCSWVILDHYSELGAILQNVFFSAFTGHAAVGGFAGSTMMLAVQNGMAGASYAADIGIGYDSTIQSESHTVYPERQARMALLGVILDNAICTLSIAVCLVANTWQVPISDSGIPPIQLALMPYFPFLGYIMPVFIFLLGFTTLVAYLIVGMKCARHLHAARGSVIYVIYSCISLLFFTFFDQTVALLVMRIAGAMLLIVNLLGIFRLRKEVVFNVDDDEMVAKISTTV